MSDTSVLVPVYLVGQVVANAIVFGVPPTPPAPWVPGPDQWTECSQTASAIGSTANPAGSLNVTTHDETHVDVTVNSSGSLNCSMTFITVWSLWETGTYGYPHLVDEQTFEQPASATAAFSTLPDDPGPPEPPGECVVTDSVGPLAL